MTSPIVSVLMTAYNREKYIADAIESVLASTFQDFELIIVDDCSTDNTLGIAHHYLSDSRVQVYKNKINLGDYPNRNRAAQLAQGEYLKYVDSDDIIYPHGLAVMLESMRQFPQAGLGLSCLTADEKQPFPIQVSPQEAYYEHFLNNGLFINAPLSSIIHRQAFETLGGFSGRRYVGDFELWLKLAAHFPVVKMTSGLTWWRAHGEQEYTSGTKSLAYAKLNYQLNVGALTKADCPLCQTDRIKALNLIQKSQLRLILSLALRFRSLYAAYKLFVDSKMTLKQLLAATLSI